MAKRKTIRPPYSHVSTHTSVLLERLIADAPTGHFTLEWLVENIPKHSFGFILLILALIGFLPIISVVSRVLIIILTFQIICGHHSPVLPDRIMKRPLPSKYLLRLTRHTIPALKHLENVIRPRWPIVLKGTRRFTALIAMLVTFISLPDPLPLSNMPPAAIGVLMALAHIEHDGLMFLLAFLAALALLIFVTWVIVQPFI